MKIPTKRVALGSQVESARGVDRILEWRAEFVSVQQVQMFTGTNRLFVRDDLNVVFVRVNQCRELEKFAAR